MKFHYDECDELIKYNEPQIMHGLMLLDMLKTSSISCFFFDPQYRGILDSLGFGNEGETREMRRTALKQMPLEEIHTFLCMFPSLLKPGGYIFLWLDKYHLLNHTHEFNDDLAPLGTTMVDMITWDKEKMGMGYRTRKQCEYLLIFQKAPRHPKTDWTVRNLRDIYRAPVDRVKGHVHAKPIGLQTELIRAVTRPGDCVVDPAAGGYSVLKACNEVRERVFIGCDLESYNGE